MSKSEESIKTDEICTGHKPIKMNIANKVMKSICKIIIKNNDKISYGTGFFLNVTNSLKYLLTNYHVINQNSIGNLELEIWNQNRIKLNLDNRQIKYFEKPKDITIVEIKNTDEIYKDIEFLDYDINYKNKGYIIYKNVDVFSIEHPYGEDASCASGKIKNIYEYEFNHNISTDNGSSGCPIILLNDNINLIQIIGIHKNSDRKEKINGGTFIGEIFKELNNNFNKRKDNYIISEIIIEDDDINKNIRIINCYEEYMRNKIKEDPNLNEFKEGFKKKYYPNGKLNKDLMNEQEIKKCEMVN